MRMKLFFSAIVAGLLATTVASGAGNTTAPKETTWKHSGPFGTYDRTALQRGLQVYLEVCAGCHSMRLVAFRTLTEIGLSEAEVKALAAGMEVRAGPDGEGNVLTDDGEFRMRPAKPSDRIPSPFPNELAARAGNNGAFPPDFSLIVKARPGHENYIYSLLTGYAEPPGDVKLMEGMSYNPYFPGGQIAMGEPLSEDAVEYADGTKATVDQMAKDVVSFLTWAGEPSMEERKRMGIKVVLFLIVLTLLLYMVKRKVWSDLH
jgi:ubiquinol-cytochrome c reductase cytochrome c1 subunit